MKKWRVTKALLPVASTVLLGGNAVAATRHVAPRGNDAAAGTESAPWATLQYAVSHVDPGDTILVTSGTYLGCRIETSGAPGAPKTLAAAPSAQVFVTAPGPANRHHSAIEIENFDAPVTDWRIVGIDVESGPVYGIDARGTDRVTVDRCHVHDNGRSGVFTAFSNHFSVTRTETDHNGEHGIYLANSGDFPAVAGNRSHHNAACGVQLNGDLSMGGDGIISYFRIEANTIYENGNAGGAGINLDGATDGLIINNVILANHAGGIALFGDTGAMGSSRNRVYNNTIVMAANSRDVITIAMSPNGRPNPADNQIVNNILYTPDARRAAVSTYSSNVPGLRSDFNVGMDRFSVDGGGTLVSLRDWQKLGNDAHFVAASPDLLFVNPQLKDLRLRANSPAIRAGMSFPGLVDRDIEGTARDRTQAWDIGAYAR